MNTDSVWFWVWLVTLPSVAFTPLLLVSWVMWRLDRPRSKR